MTTRQEIIERLKGNRTPFKWLSDEEKETIRKTDINNIMYLHNSIWEYKLLDSVFYEHSVYRIHESYTEEAERPEAPCRIASSHYGDVINQLIDCIKWLYAKVERMEK